MQKTWARGLVALVLAGCGGTASDFGATSEALSPPDAISLTAEEVLAAPPSRVLSPVEKWRLAFQRHDEGEFSTAAQMFTELAGTFPLARSLAARSLMEEGRLADAYREAVTGAREVEHSVSWFVLGLVAFRDGRLDEAQEAYEHALALDPNHAASHNNLGGIYYHHEDFTRGRAETERALELSDDAMGESIAMANLAEFDQLDGDLAGAEARLDRALELTPEEAHPYFGLAQLYDVTGREDAARRMAEAGLEIDWMGRTRRSISFVWPELEWHHDALLAEARGDEAQARELWGKLYAKELKQGVRWAPLAGRARVHLDRLASLAAAPAIVEKLAKDAAVFEPAPVEGDVVDGRMFVR